jgi:hypothetical protein
MFTIDLLKGRGIPVRNRPENIAVAAVTVAVPVIIALIMFGYYMRSSIVLSVQKQEIIGCDTQISKMSEAAALQKTFESEKKIANGCLSEVATNIKNHIQWTPVLVEIVKNMPNSILLTGINVKEDNITKKVFSKETGKTTDVSVPVRTLQINVFETSGSVHGQSIRDFQDSLRSSAVFGPQLDNISVSQGVEKLKGQDVVSYQIDCSFKPGI